MAFGAPSGKNNLNQNNTVEVAKKNDNLGVITDLYTHGGMQEVTEEVFADSITNEALNGQSGTSVVSAHGYQQVFNDYAKATKTTQSVLAAAVTTTTTTT